MFKFKKTYTYLHVRNGVVVLECEDDYYSDELSHEDSLLLWRSLSGDEPFHPHIPLELAFLIDDPVGDLQLQLAREVLKLIANRDDVACAAILPELRFLNRKYPPRTKG